MVEEKIAEEKREVRIKEVGPGQFAIACDDPSHDHAKLTDADITKLIESDLNFRLGLLNDVWKYKPQDGKSAFDFYLDAVLNWVDAQRPMVLKLKGEVPADVIKKLTQVPDRYDYRAGPVEGIATFVPTTKPIKKVPKKRTKKR